MFENEQKYIVKIADDIQRIQEERDRFMAIQHPSNNLIISEHVERAGGVGQLFGGFMILILPLFFIFEKFGIISCLIILFCGLCFRIFPNLLVGSDSCGKFANVNWGLLCITIGSIWIPILGLVFGMFFWYLLALWWGIFLLWRIMRFIIETKIEAIMNMLQMNLKELEQIHFGAIFDMSLDFYSPNIYPKQVIKIRDSIGKMTDQIQKTLELQQSLAYEYQRWFGTFWSVFFRRKVREQVELFFQNESRKLLTYVNTFSQDLCIWRGRHQMELSQLGKTIERQKLETPRPEGQVALELLQDRIESLTQETDVMIKK